MLQCFNRGCREAYDPDDNYEFSCRHHPGSHLFYERYNCYSCCSKGSHDFIEFLGIEGCTLSRHSNVIPTALAVESRVHNSPPDPNDLGRGTYESSFIPMPRPKNLPSMIRVEPIMGPSVKEEIDDYAEEEAKTDRKTFAESEVPVGTLCKNSGCRYSYAGTEADNKECEYHSGNNIFDGELKYWSCCQKKTTDFKEFIAQKGCCRGTHKWFKEIPNKFTVRCCHDCHQIVKKSFVDMHTKMNHDEDSIAQVFPIRLRVNLALPKLENRCFKLHLKLFPTIEPNEKTVQMNVGKVELYMTEKGEPENKKGWLFADKANDEPGIKTEPTEEGEPHIKKELPHVFKIKAEPETEDESPDAKKYKQDPETEKESFVEKKVKVELQIKKEVSYDEEVNGEQQKRNGLPDTDKPKDGPEPKENEIRP